MSITEINHSIMSALVKINHPETTQQEKLDGFVALITLLNSKISLLSSENEEMLSALIARKAYPWYGKK